MLVMMPMPRIARGNDAPRTKGVAFAGAAFATIPIVRTAVQWSSSLADESGQVLVMWVEGLLFFSIPVVGRCFLRPLLRPAASPIFRLVAPRLLPSYLHDHYQFYHWNVRGMRWQKKHQRE